MRTSVTDKVLAQLKAGRSMTALDSLQQFGCMRLAARIYVLRAQGYDILTERVEVPSGKVVARYSLQRGGVDKNAEM